MPSAKPTLKQLSGLSAIAQAVSGWQVLNEVGEACRARTINWRHGLVLCQAPGTEDTARTPSEAGALGRKGLQGDPVRGLIWLSVAGVCVLSWAVLVWTILAWLG